MKKSFALALVLLLAACSSEPRVEPIRLDYTTLGKIQLNTSDLRIINRTQNTPQYQPYVGHQFKPTLVEAVQRYASDRLHASGGMGHATLIIKDANVTEQSMATSSDFESMFTRQQASKLIGRVEVSLEAQSPTDGAVGMANAHAVYSVSLPEDPSQVERQEAYRKLLTTLMSDLNRELERSISTHMTRFTGAAAQQSEGATAPKGDSTMPIMLEE